MNFNYAKIIRESIGKKDYNEKEAKKLLDQLDQNQAFYTLVDGVMKDYKSNADNIIGKRMLKLVAYLNRR